MKIALISDIHANLEALTAVFGDIEKQRADRVCCLGDVVGYGGDPLACLELVERHCTIRLLGNHEHAAMGLLAAEHLNDTARRSLNWTQGQLDDRALAIMAEFALEATHDNLRMVHASPHEPERWHYILTVPEADAAFRHFGEKICFTGHSHLPMIFGESPDGNHRRQVGHDFLPDPDGRYLINIGSVGQPRDNDPRACYVLFDTEEWEVLYRRVKYDLATTQRKMRQANLPTALVERLEAGR